MLALLDVIFLWLHIIVIVFNLVGWIWKRTRKAHLIVLITTLSSWLLLGIRYGLGYCFLTDWHWEVKMKLGERGLPNSFIKYFFDRYTFLHVSAPAADIITGITIVIIILMTIYVNCIKKNHGKPDRPKA